MNVKTYYDWLAINEAYENGLVALCRAYSSESNVTASLARKMGNADNTKQYSFTLKSIEHVSYLANAVAAAKVEQIADPRKNDVLSINGKTAVEKGSIVLTKSELGKEINVIASNNGLLTLFRLADCFADMKRQSKVSISQCSDFMVKLEIGNPTSMDEARGFSYAAINPGKAQSTANGIAASLMLMLAEASNMNPNSIDFQSDLVMPVHKRFVEPYLQNSNYQEALTSMAKSYAEGLKNRNFLVATEFVVPVDHFQEAVSALEPYLKSN